MFFFEQDENDAVENQCCRDGDGVKKVFLNEPVEEQSGDSGGDEGDERFCPQKPFVAPFRSGSGKGPQFAAEEYDDRQNRAGLNEDFEDGRELPVFGKPDEFVGQNHVSRAADGKKFGDSFNQSQQKCF